MIEQLSLFMIGFGLGALLVTLMLYSPKRPYKPENSPAMQGESHPPHTSPSVAYDIPPVRPCRDDSTTGLSAASALAEWNVSRLRVRVKILETYLKREVEARKTAERRLHIATNTLNEIKRLATFSEID